MVYKLRVGFPASLQRKFKTQISHGAQRNLQQQREIFLCTFGAVSDSNDNVVFADVIVAVTQVRETM